MTNVLVCIKRVPDAAGEVLLTADEQALDARFVGFTVSAARELRRRAGGADRRGRRRHGDRADPGPGRRRRAAARRARRRLRRRPCWSRPTRSASGPPTWRARSPRWSRPRGRGPHLRPDPARQRRRRHRRLPGRHPAGLRAGPPRRQRGRARSRSRTASRRPAATASTASRPTRCRCPPSSTVLEGGVEPRYPTITGPDEGEEDEDRDGRAPTGEPRGSGRVRLTLPPAQPSTVEVLGDAAPRPRPPSSTCCSAWGWRR